MDLWNPLGERDYLEIKHSVSQWQDFQGRIVCGVFSKGTPLITPFNLEKFLLLAPTDLMKPMNKTCRCPSLSHLDGKHPWKPSGSGLIPAWTFWPESSLQDWRQAVFVPHQLSCPQPSAPFPLPAC